MPSSTRRSLPQCAPREHLSAELILNASLTKKILCNVHLHFKALENQNVSSFPMLRLAANSKFFPLASNLVCSLFEPARFSLQVSGWGNPQGVSGAAMLPSTTWLDCANLKVPAEIPTLVWPPGHRFFVASSAVDVSRLSRLSRSTVRLPRRDP